MLFRKVSAALWDAQMGRTKTYLLWKQGYRMSVDILGLSYKRREQM